MKFADLEVHPDLIRATTDMGFEDLTPIQEQCLTPALAGRDIAGIAQTGTGKTVAFLLPILHRILSEEAQGPAALIVTPTRELCLQIAEEAHKLTAHRELAVCAVYGGEQYRRQEEELAKNPAIIVATPGRLIDYMKQRKVETGRLRFLVLDEADRMFDMGFIRDVRYIMRHVPDDAQCMLFSATLSYYVLRLASDFMKDPHEVRIESESVAVDKIEQSLLHLGRDERDAYLVNTLLNTEGIRAIVFTNYRQQVQRLERLLQRYGIAATGISSLLDQKKRIRLLKGFKTGSYSVLVATDVASRGLDVEDVSHVFNYDLPQDGESYVHRIGRTARAGRSGVSMSFCSESDYENLPRIHRYINQKIPVAEPILEYLQMPQGQFEAFRDRDERKDQEEMQETNEATTTEPGAERPRRSRSRRRRRSPDNTRPPGAENEQAADEVSEKPEGENQARGEGEPRKCRGATRFLPAVSGFLPEQRSPRCWSWGRS